MAGTWREHGGSTRNIREHAGSMLGTRTEPIWSKRGTWRERGGDMKIRTSVARGGKRTLNEHRTRLVEKKQGSSNNPTSLYIFDRLFHYILYIFLLPFISFE